MLKRLAEIMFNKGCKQQKVVSTLAETLRKIAADLRRRGNADKSPAVKIGFGNVPKADAAMSRIISWKRVNGIITISGMMQMAVFRMCRIHYR